MALCAAGFAQGHLYQAVLEGRGPPGHEGKRQHYTVKPEPSFINITLPVIFSVQDADTLFPRQ